MTASKATTISNFKFLVLVIDIDAGNRLSCLYIPPELLLGINGI